MSVINLFFSPTGNTKKVVTELSKRVSKVSVSYDITTPENRIQKPTLTQEDLVFVGVPVYGGRVPKMLVEYFKNLHGNNAKAVLIVTYGNRDYEDALLELGDLFIKNGFHAIAGGTFIGEHSATELLGTDRPDVDDLKIIKEMSREILQKLDLPDDSNMNTLSLPGNYPYVSKETKSVLIAPVTNESCTNCGVCMRTCPTGAIDKKDCNKIDASKCIRCGSCVKKCPLKAKKITHPGYRSLQETLVQNFSAHRRKSEYFI